MTDQLHSLVVRLIRAVYRYEKELNALRRTEGVEMGHQSIVEKIARRFGNTPEEKILIMETLANYRGEE